MPRRDDLPSLERAVSDALDEYLIRMHGTMTSHTRPDLFLDWLRERGYHVVEAPPKPIYDGPATLTDQSGTPLDVHVQVLVNPRDDTGDCTVLATVQHYGIAIWLGTRCTLRLPDGRETALAKVMSMGSLVELHGPQPELVTTTEETSRHA